MSLIDFAGKPRRSREHACISDAKDGQSWPFERFWQGQLHAIKQRAELRQTKQTAVHPAVKAEHVARREPST